MRQYRSLREPRVTTYYMKLCRKCLQEKSRDQFHVARRNSDGLQSYCKECDRTRSRDNYRKRHGVEILPLGVRRCVQCRETKAEDSFYRRGKGRRSECIECVRENAQAFKRANPQYWQENDRRRKVDACRWLVDYLLEHPCVDCGESDPLVLEFDHVQSVKYGRVTTILTLPWQKILEEIGRCEVRCANCHARVTHERLNSRRYQQCLGFKYPKVET